MERLTTKLFLGRIAQLVEQLAHNEKVGGSNPSVTTIKIIKIKLGFNKLISYIYNQQIIKDIEQTMIEIWIS